MTTNLGRVFPQANLSSCSSEFSRLASAREIVADWVCHDAFKCFHSRCYQSVYGDDIRRMSDYENVTTPPAHCLVACFVTSLGMERRYFAAASVRHRT